MFLLNFVRYDNFHITFQLKQQRCKNVKYQNTVETETLWIGACKLFEHHFTGKQTHKVYPLGVWFSTLGDTSLDINFIEKIEKIRRILNNWSTRRLTLVGKIGNIKTLAVSQTCVSCYVFSFNAYSKISTHYCMI